MGAGAGSSDDGTCVVEAGRVRAGAECVGACEGCADALGAGDPAGRLLRKPGLSQPAQPARTMTRIVWKVLMLLPAKAPEGHHDQAALSTTLVADAVGSSGWLVSPPAGAGPAP